MTVEDIMISPARVLLAPYGESHPLDSLAYGGSWPGNWVDLGMTNNLVSWNLDREIYKAEVQQRLAAVAAQVIKEECAVETTLAEINGDNLAYLTGGILTTTSAGVGQVGKSEIVGGGEFVLGKYAVGIEGVHVKTSGTKFPARLFLYLAVIKLNGALEFAKEQAAGLAFRAEALADTSLPLGSDLYKIQRITAAATPS